MGRLLGFLLAITVCLISGCIPFVSGSNRNFDLAGAAIRGDISEVDKTLKDGADVNSRPLMSDENKKGYPTILMLVSQQTTNNEAMRLEVVKYLLEKGANPWLTDAEGKTALDYAKRCNSKIASYLGEYMLDHSKNTYQVH